MDTEAPPPSWAAEIIARLDRIERALRLSPETSPNDIITRKHLAVLLGCKSEAALSRRSKALGIVRIAHGLYRRGDVANAIARASLRAQNRSGRCHSGVSFT